MSEDLAIGFDRAMHNILDRAAALKPPLTFPGFRSMLADNGGKRTADILLARPDVTEGFKKLVIHSLETGNQDALQLAVEHLVLEQPWRQLFTPAQQRIAERRLRQVGYEPPVDSGDLGRSTPASSAERTTTNLKRPATKQIRDLPSPRQRHTRYADVVESEGWTPLILCDSAGCYWNSSTAQTREGQIRPGISAAAQQHLLSLLQAGEFGADALNAFVDRERWDYIHDNLLNWPKPEIIARESLRVLPLRRPSNESKAEAASSPSLGPTTGPRPTSWTGVVSRNAGEQSHTYVFQFGDRDLWKIGHAMDVQARLVEVNKHVPFEVLGEQWKVCLYCRCDSQDQAYTIEQRLLGLLRTPTSVAERVICTREALERAWISVVQELS